MPLSIRLSSERVKELQEFRLRAYGAGDVRGVRRASVLLEVLSKPGAKSGAGAELAVQWKIGVSTIYGWTLSFMQQGMSSLQPRWGGGRPSQLTPSQKQQLCVWLDAGPQACGFASACWSSVLVAQLIAEKFGVLYNRFYVCQLLRHLGYSRQKAQFVSDHLDPQRRQEWLEQAWPRILEQARARGAMILFGDECSFAQWGSLSHTWSRTGHTPVVKTSGQRRACKVFGLIEFFSGRFFHAVIEGRFNSQSYCAFLQEVLSQTQGRLFLIQDGARYHTSAATRTFFTQHQERLSVFQLPSYSPDYNPIEYLWRNAKKQATHNKYFACFEQLTGTVQETLRRFALQPQAVLQLFGRYCREADFALTQFNIAA